MRLLLDTHVLLWWLADDTRLPPSHRALIADTSNQVLVSSVSVVEISIKASQGRLEAPIDVQGAALESGFEFLDFDADHAEELRELPWHHRDPFDRMLIAQARFAGLVLLTVDERVRAYGISVAS